ncbi:hypothetical protein HKW97_24065 (plasmid) [Pseudomonas luteola]|uniref:conjugative transfer protein MobI(A/C) n=1 Tax=Pseudomonas luteola TaxID=47886 RepID=UPI00388F5758
MAEQFSNEQLAHLVSEKSSLSDSGIDAADLIELTRTAVAELEKQTERLTYLNALQAKEACEFFWQQAREGQERHKQYPRLGSRVRLLKNSLLILWYNSSYLLKPKSGGDRKFTAKHISKPRHKFRYSNASLSNCYEWEKENIVRTEDDYEKLRVRQSLITEMRAKLAKFKQVTDEFAGE